MKKKSVEADRIQKIVNSVTKLLVKEDCTTAEALTVSVLYISTMFRSLGLPYSKYKEFMNLQAERMEKSWNNPPSNVK